jgi:hypothetical protein
VIFWSPNHVNGRFEDADAPHPRHKLPPGAIPGNFGKSRVSIQTARDISSGKRDRLRQASYAYLHGWHVA